MLLPLLVMASVFTLLFLWLLLLRMRTALNQCKIEALRLHAPAMRSEIGTDRIIPASRPALR